MKIIATKKDRDYHDSKVIVELVEFEYPHEFGTFAFIVQNEVTGAVMCKMIAQTKEEAIRCFNEY